MKINSFLTVISAALSVLVGYLAFTVAEGEQNDIVCGIASSICFAVTLIPAIGLRYVSARLSVNIRVFSFMFFVVFAISHFSFAGLGVKMPYYVIVNGILLLMYLAIFYKMQGIKDL